MEIRLTFGDENEKKEIASCMRWRHSPSHNEAIFRSIILPIGRSDNANIQYRRPLTLTIIQLFIPTHAKRDFAALIP